MKKRNVLVIGATSILGQEVCKKLKNKNCIVYAVDIQFSKEWKLEDKLNTEKYAYKALYFFDMNLSSNWVYFENFFIDDVYFLLKNNNTAQSLCFSFYNKLNINNLITLDNLSDYITLGPS
jgi:hypothetical protein